jgi:hypothetical protein
MRPVIAISALYLALAAPAAAAGQMVRSTIYVPHDVAQGEGLTHAQALADARAAVPVDCAEDPKNTSVYECTESNEYFARTGIMECDTGVPGNRYRVTLPLVCR